MEKRDIVIIGGGPSGAYCAVELGKRGISSTIINQWNKREKPCGGGITSLAMEKFPFIKKIYPHSKITKVYKIILMDNREKIFRGKKRFNISRRILDKRIINMALKKGAEIINEKVIDLEYQKSHWKIKTDKRYISTRILVGADGINSIVRAKTIGSINIENLGIACGYTVKGLEKEDITIKFVNGLKGYIWLFPRKFYSSIGIGSQFSDEDKRDQIQNMKHILDNFANKSNFPKIQIIRKSNYCAKFPFATDYRFFDKKCVSAKQNWILIGDAAGHVDPIFGEGILYALWSGKIAAKAIATEDVGWYQKKWQKEYGNHLKKQCKLKKDFYNPKFLNYFILSQQN